MVFLFFHIVIYSSFKKLRQSQPSRNLLCLVCSLFVGQVLFFFGFDIQFSQTICLFAAIGSHYFLLVSFFCMNVISFDICRTFVSYLPTSSSRRRMKVYTYYTWATPLLIVASANVIDRVPVPSFLQSYKPNYAEHVCWINNQNSSFLFFVLPIGSLVVENFIFFVLTVYGIQSKTFKEEKESKTFVKFAVSKDEKTKDLSKRKIYFLIYLKLSIIMGLTWLFGFLASFLKMNFLWYLFIIFNSLQGTFIFIFFDLKWKVYYTAYEKIMGKPHPNKGKAKTLGKQTNTSSRMSSSRETPSRGTGKSSPLPTKKEDQSKKGVSIDNTNISEYNAWQQLKIFQSGLKSGERGSALVRQKPRCLVRQKRLGEGTHIALHSLDF